MELHPVEPIALYVQVLLPLALAKPYTYAVPVKYADAIQLGVRVDVQFGKKRRYTGLVVDVSEKAPDAHDVKPISGVVDELPIVRAVQITFWKWLAEYYCCTLGEVMNAALPAHFRLVSDTQVMLGEAYEQDISQLDDKEYLILEALSIQHTLSIKQVQDILQQRSVLSLIRRMLDKKLIALEEDLKERYKARTVTCLRLCEPYRSDPSALKEAFEKVRRAERQTEALMAYIQLARTHAFVRKEDLYKKAQIDSSVLSGLVKKAILEPFEREVSRLAAYEEEVVEAAALSPLQVEAYDRMTEVLKEKDVVLLHGVTGSGKTRIYVELIKEAIQNKEQVLYLLPEIALTTQVIDRLRRIFGDQVVVYHSRFNNNERVEVWQQVLQGKSLVLGARSAVFLPFQRLKWVIIDEEHDPSYKQQEPNPRYQGRDAAIYLARLYGAKTILGTATPSLESYFNAQSGKYGQVELSERFGGLQMPELRLVNLKAAQQSGKLHTHFSEDLLEALRQTLADGEQAILFQNRRGFSPTYRCETCSWHATCVHCDVSLTYHKSGNQLKCHYCNYKTTLPIACPACGSKTLSLQGFGTEKIEEELKIFLPNAAIARMDYDTVRGKHAHAQLIQEFEEGRIQVLVGTQMVTKGLDFERVGLVGILSADQLLQFPDFRASERGFQLMTQVSGRAGRKFRRGRVIIQAYNIGHPVLKNVLEHDFQTFVQRELQERLQFQYPPYFRLIRITLKHLKPEKVNQAAELLAQRLLPLVGQRLKGPAMPSVSRVRGYYILDFLLKMDRTDAVGPIKKHIMEGIEYVQHKEGLSALRVQVDVDPA